MGKDQRKVNSDGREDRWLIFAAVIPGALLVLWRILYLYNSYLSTAKLDAELKTFDILFKVASISAVSIGAWWSYRLFFRQRLTEARLNVDHKTLHIILPNGGHLVKVYATVTNVGQVKVVLTCWRLCAEQILPLDSSHAKLTGQAFTDKEVPWTSVAHGIFTPAKDNKREAFWMLLEPGETDQVVGNFIIPGEIEVIQVYSHFSLIEKEGSQGWENRVLVDLRNLSTGSREESMSTHEHKGINVDIRPTADSGNAKVRHTPLQQHHTPPVRPDGGNQGASVGTQQSGESSKK